MDAQQHEDRRREVEAAHPIVDETMPDGPRFTNERVHGPGSRGDTRQDTAEAAERRLRKT